MTMITEALTTEHRVFTAIFDHIERVLPEAQRVEEVRLLAGLVEALLRAHSEAETNLAYVALDHVLADRGELDQLHQDHHEIDGRLRGAQAAKDRGEARRLLKGALRVSREHFAREEQAVFPLINRSLSPEVLAALGKAWAQRDASAGHSPEPVATRA